MKNVSLVACLAGLVVVGCSQGEPASVPSASSATPAIDGSNYLLATEPAGASDVILVRAQSKDQEDVVVVGRIGGSQTPWVDGRAAFTIVDSSLKSCLEVGCDDCDKPWDFC